MKRALAAKRLGQVGVVCVLGVVASLLALKTEVAVGVGAAILVVMLAIPVLKRFRLPVVLSFLFLALDVLLNQQFSHFAVPRPPLFITEVFMVVLTVILKSMNALKVPKSAILPLAAIGLLVVIGVIANYPKNGLPAIRDAAELYYVAFIPLSYSVYRMIWGARRTPYDRGAAQTAIIIASIIASVFFLITRHHQVPGASESFLGILLFLQLGWHWSKTGERWLFLIFPLTLAAILVQGARGPWVGVGLGLVCLVVLSYKVENGSSIRRRLARLLLFFLVVVVPLGLLTSPALYAHIQRDMVSIFQTNGTYYQVANNRWRWIIWGQALKQIGQDPFAIRIGQQWVPAVLANYGFSIATTGYQLGTIALSNSYLQIVQWWGIWPIVPLALIAIGSVKGFAMVDSRGYLRPMQVVALSALAMWSAVILVEVVLEGPYMSVVVWSLVGLGYFYRDWRIREANHP
jgi:hypothetical protein